MKRTILIRADWDDEAGVWVATSKDIDGLATEAETLQALKAKIEVIIPELVELNGFCADLPEIPIHIFAENTFSVPNTKCA